jgi:hypothetical protein
VLLLHLPVLVVVVVAMMLPQLLRLTLPLSALPPLPL